MIEKGITFPRGFLAAGAYAGIGKPEGDLALLFCEGPASAAGVFTQNRLAAAPVLLSRERVARGELRAVIVNSGNANAGTGPRGLSAAAEMARFTAEALGLTPEEVAVASTGVIGVQLPLEKLPPALPGLVASLSREGGSAAARAILTTDTFPKEAGRSLELGGREVRIGGMAKGSGMIHPNLATMLGFITTDAQVEPAVLGDLLREGAARSFNQITVDGDESTNDMVLALSSGRAGGPALGPDHPDFPAFGEAFIAVLIELAQAVARDGEGATKFLTVAVQGAKDDSEARRAARAVAGSSLVKTALFGEDANWGRILAAIGAAGVQVSEERLAVWLGPVSVLRDGSPTGYSEEEATRAVREREVVIRADLGVGSGRGEAWGCDLSYEYVKINGSYRS